MERRLLTLLMLSAFGMNVSANSFWDVLKQSPSNISQFFSKIAGNAKTVVLDGVKQTKDFFSHPVLTADEKASSDEQWDYLNLALGERVEKDMTGLENANDGLREEVKTLQKNEQILAAELVKAQDENKSLKQNTFKNRTRAAFGSAWSGAKHYGTKAKDGAKYCGTKAKNAALWAPKKAVNTTFGGKMNSLSTDWTNLTTGLTPLTTGLDKTQKMNSVKQLSSNVWGSIKQLSSNAWTNKKASAKIAAATVATGIGAYYAGKLVKSASKSLYGKYQARKAAARLAAEKEAADKNAEAARLAAAAEETARKSVTVVAQNPRIKQLCRNGNLEDERTVNELNLALVEYCNQTGTTGIEATEQFLKLYEIVTGVRHIYLLNVLKPTPTPVTPVATPAVTDEIVTPAAAEKVEAPVAAEQVVGRVAQIKAGIAKAAHGIIGAPQKGWVNAKKGAAFLYNNRPFQYNVSKKSDAPSVVKSDSEATIEAESKSSSIGSLVEEVLAR